MDDVDRSVWSNILLNNMLKKCHDIMWEAIHNGQHVKITAGESTAEFIPHDGRIRVEIDGLRVADVDASPARYGVEE
jgi:hypothetical protein